MSVDLDKLERDVQRQMALLRSLPAVMPRRECVERVQAAVAAEAARVSPHPRALRVVQIGLGVAAAVILAIGLSTRSAQPVKGGPDPETALGEWVAAWDESSNRLTNLVEKSWLGSDGEAGRDDAAELDDLLRSFDQSFENLGGLQDG